MKNFNRMIAGILSLTIVFPTMQTPAYAAGQSVTTNESMYVNLNYFGEVEKVNIVKTCSLNGNNQFEDYGSYLKVNNMTNKAVPCITAKSVKWNLPENTGDFYYECTPKTKIQLPWTFIVSYKLNGVTTDPKKLAGASGTIEVNIKATPNENANEYYKNNMILEVCSYIDMADNLSVDAPGAQIMPIGGKKIVMFAAMPGEEQEFTMRIGTKKFETTGIYMMMTPGTLDQLSKFKDIKEAKDTIDDSLDVVHESTNSLLSTIESLSSGLKQTNSGLYSLDKARNTINSSKSSLFSKSEKSLADITKLTSNLTKLIPHFKEGQNAIQEFNMNINSITKTLNETKADMDAYSTSIRNIQKNISDLQDILKNVNEKSKKRKEIITNIQKDIDAAKDDLDDLSDQMDSLSKDISEIGTSIGDLQNALTKELSAISSSPDYSGAFTTSDGVILYQTLMALTKSMANLSSSLNSSLYDLRDTSSSAASTADTMRKVCDNGSSYLDTVSSTVSLTEQYFEDLDKANTVTDSMLTESKNICSTTDNLLSSGKTLIDNISAFTDTANKYKDSSITSLQDMETLSKSMIDGLTSSQSFLSAFESTLKASSNDLNQGTYNSLNGMINILKKSIDGIGTTSIMKKANNTIKKTLDDKEAEYEDDSNVLNLDINAKPLSFTSNKNSSPESVSIILRTEEISTPDDNPTKTSETSDQKVNPFKRMLNILVEIKNSVISIFENRE